MSLSKVPQYSQFSALMHKEYELAVQKLRNNLARGLTYDQACDTLSNLDGDMRTFVREDFLKILIAEEHFGAGIEISDIALYLGLPYDVIESSMLSLIYDMVREAEAHRQQAGMLEN